MSDASIPVRFARNYALAKRYGSAAIGVMLLVMAVMLVAAINDFFWIAFGAVFLGMPAAWLLNLQCYACHWPLLRLYGTAPARAVKDQFFAPLQSKMTMSLPSLCSKCGVAFEHPATSPQGGENWGEGGLR